MKQVWLLFLWGVSPWVFSQGIYLDHVDIGVGYGISNTKLHLTNGGVVGVDKPDSEDLSLRMGAVFHNDYLPALKPYADVVRYGFDDRRFTLVGLGLRHEREMDSRARLGWFFSAGVGIADSYWKESPVVGNATGVAGDESFAGTLQTGVFWYFTDHLALDFNFRFDAYDLDTSVVQNGSVTTINDQSAATAQIGLNYRFGRVKTGFKYADDDKDGVPNPLDQCPDSLMYAPINNWGCYQKTFILNLSFNFGQYRIEDMVERPAFSVVEFLVKNTQYHVHINGYTDSAGSPSYNQKLSYWRAKSAADFLLEQGVASARVNYEGKGESLPLLENESDANRQANRRIEVIFFVPTDRPFIQSFSPAADISSTTQQVTP